MAIQTTWKIRAPSDHCSLSGAAFADGEVFYTCLSELPGEEGYLREDFSESSWEQVKEQRSPFSFWRSVFEAKPPVDPEAGQPLRKNDAESLLFRLQEEDSPTTLRTRYILALMLERKRILRPVSHETDAERPVLVYEHAKSGEVILVTDPRIRLEEVEEVEREVRELLGGGEERAEATGA
jgi:hypothetical protein